MAHDSLARIQKQCSIISVSPRTPSCLRWLPLVSTLGSNPTSPSMSSQTDYWRAKPLRSFRLRLSLAVSLVERPTAPPVKSINRPTVFPITTSRRLGLPSSSKSLLFYLLYRVNIRYHQAIHFLRLWPASFLRLFLAHLTKAHRSFL